MKFTHTLKFNAVPEWREYYLAYPALKKIIYAITSAEYHEGYEGAGGEGRGDGEGDTGRGVLIQMA